MPRFNDFAIIFTPMPNSFILIKNIFFPSIYTLTFINLPIIGTFLLILKLLFYFFYSSLDIIIMLIHSTRYRYFIFYSILVFFLIERSIAFVLHSLL